MKKQRNSTCSKLNKISLRHWAIACLKTGYAWLLLVMHGYSWLCMVIVGYSWFSNLALDSPVNEETKKINLLETEQKSHSDTGL